MQASIDSRFLRSAATGAALTFSLTFASATAFAQSCPDGYPYDCGDGYCCPDGAPVCCGGGQCSDGSCDGGGSGSTCPDSAPYLCDDGYCYETSDCGGGGSSCPDSAPYLCDDGYCYQTSDCGGGGSSCPDSAPYLCDDGYCYETSDCGGGSCPDSAPYQCGDGLCYASSDCAYCPPGYPYDCGNGYCSTSSDGCSAGESLPGGGSSPGVGGGTAPVGGGSGTAPGGGSGEEFCEDAGAYEGCDSVQACCTATECRYVTDDGSTFYCGAGGDCYTAADDVVAYCEDQAGCSATPGKTRGGLTGMAAFAMLGLAAAVRALRSRRRG